MGGIAPGLNHQPLPDDPGQEHRKPETGRPRPRKTEGSGETDAGQSKDGRVQAVEVTQLVRPRAPAQRERATESERPSHERKGFAQGRAGESGDPEAHGQREGDDHGKRGSFRTIDDEGDVEPEKAGGRAHEGDEAAGPQPAWPHGGDRAGRGHRGRTRRPDETRHEEGARAEGETGKAKEKGPARPKAGGQQPDAHAHERGDRQGRVPDRQTANEAEPGGHRRPQWSRVAVELAQSGDERKAGDEGHHEVRTGAGHERHVRGAHGGEEGGRPAGARAQKTAGQ